MSKCTAEERVMLMQMAEMRADQVTWDAIAQKLGKSMLELRTLQYLHRRLWKNLLAEARRELLADATHEAMMALLPIINKQDDEKTVLKAANVFARLANTQAKITEQPKPKRPTNKEKNEVPAPQHNKQVPKPTPTVKNFPTEPLPNAKLPNGTMAHHHEGIH